MVEKAQDVMAKQSDKRAKDDEAILLAKSALTETLASDEDEKIEHTVTLVDDQFAFLVSFAELVRFIKAKGLCITAGEMWRNRATQELYVRSGLSWTMNSRHLDRMAVDLNLFRMYNGGFSLCQNLDDFVLLGNYWESLSEHNFWGVKNDAGVTVNDFGHFERRVKKRSEVFGQ